MGQSKPWVRGSVYWLFQSFAPINMYGVKMWYLNFTMWLGHCLVSWPQPITHIRWCGINNAHPGAGCQLCTGNVSGALFWVLCYNFVHYLLYSLLCFSAVEQFIRAKYERKMYISKGGSEVASKQTTTAAGNKEAKTNKPKKAASSSAIQKSSQVTYTRPINYLHGLPWP